jgi:hypothetical protein
MKLSRLLSMIAAALDKNGDVDVRLTYRGDCPDIGGVRMCKGTLLIEDVWTKDKRTVDCSENSEGDKEG